MCKHAGARLGDLLHALARELGQVAVQRELVVQDLVRLDLDVCARLAAPVSAAR